MAAVAGERGRPFAGVVRPPLIGAGGARVCRRDPARDHAPKMALSTGFGFGGQNGAVVMQAA